MHDEHVALACGTGVPRLCWAGALELDALANSGLGPGVVGNS